MKNKLKLYLTLWAVLFTFLNVNAQCDIIMKFFKDDVYTSKELVAFAEKNPQKAFDSWKVLYSEKNSLTKNLEELTLVSKNLEAIKSAGGYMKWKAVSTAGKFSDEVLEAWAKFDDNVLDVASVGKQNWKTFQNRVAEQLQSLHPGKKIGNQIALDVTYVENGITKTKTIIPDNLIQVEVNGVKKYKVIDAKTAQTDLVNKADLTSTCTQNQQPIYKMIDGDPTAGTITKVEMRGGQATGAFPNELFNQATGKATIQLESGVEFWVNTNTTDFTQYLIRPRIK